MSDCSVIWFRLEMGRSKCNSSDPIRPDHLVRSEDQFLPRSFVSTTTAAVRSLHLCTQIWSLENVLRRNESEQLYFRTLTACDFCNITRDADARIHYAKPVSWLRRFDFSHQIDLMIPVPYAGLSVGSASAAHRKSAVRDPSRRTVGGAVRERAKTKVSSLTDRRHWCLPISVLRESRKHWSSVCFLARGWFGASSLIVLLSSDVFAFFPDFRAANETGQKSTRYFPTACMAKISTLWR